jgi:rod shape determining protein RodA
LLINAGDNPHYYFERQAALRRHRHRGDVVIAQIDYRRSRSCRHAALRVLALLAWRASSFVGQTALGAQRWYSLGFIQIQPSEFTVFFLILAVATYCQRRPRASRCTTSVDCC